MMRCPFCGSSFEIDIIESEAADIRTGLLHCHCGDYPPLSSSYPILAGIAILKPNMGPICDLIRSGKTREALLNLLSPQPPYLDAWGQKWLRHLSRLPSWPGRSFQRIIDDQNARWRDRMGNILVDNHDRASFRETLNALVSSTSRWVENFNYSYFRYSQPRHLEALSYSRCISSEDLPVLDLGCGMGHITWHISQRFGSGNVIGLDAQFSSLYLASKFIAPNVSFICASVESRLPFADKRLGAIFCSDAFFYFMHRVAVFEEIRRILAPGGLAMLIGLRNRLVDHLHPNQFFPLAPAEYQELVGDIPHCIVPDRQVLARYLQGLGPDCSRSLPAEAMQNEPKVSIIACARPEALRDYGRFNDWPHAEGSLKLNPLFGVESVPDNQSVIRLERHYPSEFFEKENIESKEYLPEYVAVSRQTLEDIRKKHLSPEVLDLIERFVVLAMPDCYSQIAPPLSCSLA
jgi:SAM-dependent methyltransferase